MKKAKQRKYQYDNCLLLLQDGSVYGRCSRIKCDWYLARNLAVVVAEEPFTIQQTFKSKQLELKTERDDYFKSAQENKCVVCGTTNNLNGCHVVPTSLRRELGFKFNTRLTPYDVL